MSYGVDGLTWKGTNLRRSDKSVWAWIVRGWLDEPAIVVGEDDRGTAAEGRERGGRTKDRRPVILQVQLKAATAEAMLALQVELAALWDSDDVGGNLVALNGYRGLATGQTATLASTQVVNVIPSASLTETQRQYSVELESIASPPDWQLAGP